MVLAKLGSKLDSLLVLLALIVLMGVASPHFLSADNLLNVLQQSSINALLGIGLTLVIISGGIDLSVGSILALSGLVAADLLSHGHPMPLAILASLTVGTTCGLINGLITTVTGIPPFIATLGMMLLGRSAANIYSGSKPISGLPPSFLALAGNVGGVPVLVMVVVVFYLGAAAVLTRTRLGRYAYAIGGNEQAAWLAGVPTQTYKTVIYAISGLMAAVSAVLMTARLNAASPLAGEMYELYAIAAAVIGGTSLLGGEGHVAGTLLGALIMGILRNGLNLLNVPSSWEGVVVGAVLVAAVVVDRLRHQGTEHHGPVWVRHLPRVLGGALVLSLGVAAVLHRAGQSEAQARPMVAFVPKSAGNPFWKAMEAGAQKEADRLGVRLVTLAPERETDVEAQHQIIENLIEQHAAAIILAPAGSKETVVAIKKANDARIPVLIVDSDVDHAMAAQVGARTVTYIGSDNEEGGRLAGQALGKALGGQGKVAILEGQPGHESTDARCRGFRQALAGFPGVEIAASLTANTERERGYAVAQNILQGHPDLRAIFGANDEMALGALEAVAASQRLGKVLVVGYDAAPDAVKNIQAGRMMGSVAQYPSEMGRLGVQHAVTLLHGGPPPPPVVHTRVEMIDTQNVDAFLKGD